MKIEYIYHSGFAIETDKQLLVFDYYKGDISLVNKKIIVFSSHGHPDHFNQDILKWSEKYPDITYVLSSDIKVNPSDSIYIIDTYEELKLFDINIHSFGSTDLGLSFLIKVDNTNIFFAGDLNWWYWDEDTEEEKQAMEKAFKEEINRLKENSIDIAFFPVDPRLGDRYHLGGEYFIKEITPKFFIPMHFGDNFRVTTDFAQKINSSKTKVIELNKRNQVIEL